MFNNFICKTFLLVCVCFILILADPSGFLKNANYPKSTTIENQIHFVGFYKDSVFIRDNTKLYELKKSDLSVIKTVRICSSSCGQNSIVVLNEDKNAIIVCEGTDNSLCSIWNISDLKPLYNDNTTPASVTVSSMSSRPAVSIATENGSTYVAVTYGPGIRLDHFGGQFSFHETYKFVISRLKLESGILTSDKSLPFRLPQNVKLDNYLIFFKGAFEDADHVLFVTNQKFKVGGEKYTSKLISICKNDPYFYSYTDIVLECESKGKFHNLIQDVQIFQPTETLRKDLNLTSSDKAEVIAGIFASGNDPDHPAQPTAICLYSMQTIHDKLQQARENYVGCPGTNLTDEERYLDNNVREGCLDETLNKVRNSSQLVGECKETLPLLSYVIGDVVLSTEAVFVMSTRDDRLVKLNARSIGDSTTGSETVLVYAGTSAGKVFVMNLVNAATVHVFDEIPVDTEHDIEALHVDEKHSIYAVSDRQIAKYEPFDCRRYKSCKDVIGSYSPFCGWCVYQNSSVAANGLDCQNVNKPNHWILYNGKCPSLALIKENFEVGMQSQVFFYIQNCPVPVSGDEYFCDFKNTVTPEIYFDAAKRGENGSFTCTTPMVSRHSFVILKLLVSTTSVHLQSRYNVTLAETTVMFYDCKAFTKCSKCTENKQRYCKWVLPEGRCQRDDDFTNPSSETVSEPSTCPFLVRMTSPSPYFHVGIPKVLHIEAEYLHESMELECCIAGTQCSPATVVNQTALYCSLQIVDPGTALATFPLQVKYADDYLEGKENINVTVYDCKGLVDDCSQCKVLDKAKFQCEWCAPGTCDFVGSSSCITLQSCPPPTLIKVNPSTCPVGGGTKVTIFGQDMGTSPDNISAITLAGIPCRFIKEKYVVSKTLICKAGGSSHITNGPINLRVENVTSSGLAFYYKDPSITRMIPSSGPQVGGTLVTLFGQNLAIGNRNITVCFANNAKLRQCGAASTVKANAQEDHIVAPSPPAHGDTELTGVEVVLDSNTHRNLKSTFRYLPDPIIDAVHPSKSIISGGIRLTVFGRRLKNAHRASISVAYRDQNKMFVRRRDCVLVSDEQIVCKTPGLTVAGIEHAQTETRGTMVLDGVKKTFVLKYFKDPEIGSQDFVNSSTILVIVNGHLFIEGRYLTVAATHSDVRVTVGQVRCHVVSLNNTLIKCLLPKDYKMTDVSSGALLPVNVTIGDYKKVIGYIYRDQMGSTTAGTGSSIVTIAILSSLIGLLGLIVLAVVVWRLKICVRKNETKLRYLTMLDMGGNNTSILPSGERRQSNSNDYEVINDLLDSACGTQQVETCSHFGKLENSSNEDDLYQTIDDTTRTVRNQPAPIPNRWETGHAEGEESISSLKTEFTSSTAQKNYYLSPVSLKTRTYS